MSVDPEIFTIFQHKGEWILHFAQVTEVRHIYYNLRLIQFHLQGFFSQILYLHTHYTNQWLPLFSWNPSWTLLCHRCDTSSHLWTSVANRKGFFELGGLILDSAIVNLLLNLLCSELLCTLPILRDLKFTSYNKWCITHKLCTSVPT